MMPIFDEKTSSYLKSMCVDISDLESHLLKNHANKIKLLVTYIDFLIDLRPKYYKPIQSGFSQHKYNKQVIEYWDANGILKNSQEYGTADTLRHAFIAFKEYGLLGLYKTREAEGWYPIVIITKRISAGDSVSSLENVTTIYRGASILEHTSRNYAQSWSISKRVAHEFAFVHYIGHQKHENTKRVLLRSKIRKENVFYSDIDGIEKEVIINPKELIKTPEILREEILCSNKEFEFQE